MSQFDNEIQDLILEAKQSEDFSELKSFIKKNSTTLKGLVIDGYIGDYPTFIEPVYLKPGVKIGDTVLLGPNVIIDEGCDLGAWTELGNVILSKNVVTGKLTKLKWCVVDSDITLPENFNADNSFITKNESGKLEIKSF